MGRKRTATDKRLPLRWQRKNGAFYYLPRDSEKPLFDGRAWFRLGATYPEALREYAARLDLQTGDTIESIADRYTAELLPALAKSSRVARLASLERIKTAMGHNQAALITPQMVYKYIDHIRSIKSANTANVDLSAIIVLFDCAVKWGVIDRNDIKGNVKRFGIKDGASAPRARYVEDWELSAWSSVASPIQRAFASLVLLTGARKREILALRRSDITPDYLRIKSTKTGKETHFAITPALNEALSLAIGTRKKPSFFVLSNRNGESFIQPSEGTAAFDKAWQRSMRKAIKETDLREPFTRHDLRAKAGSDAETTARAQQLLGHSSPAMTRRHYRRKAEIIQPAR